MLSKKLSEMEKTHQKKLNSLHTLVIDKLYNCSINLKTIDIIFNEFKNIDINSRGLQHNIKQFFGHTRKQYENSLILNISHLIDTDSHSIQGQIKTVIKHYNKGETNDEFNNLITFIQGEEIKNLKKLRDKTIAHHDFDYNEKNQNMITYVLLDQIIKKLYITYQNIFDSITKPEEHMQLKYTHLCSNIIDTNKKAIKEIIKNLVINQ